METREENNAVKMKKNDTVKGINKFVLPLWEMELRGAWYLPCPYLKRRQV